MTIPHSIANIGLSCLIAFVLLTACDTDPSVATPTGSTPTPTPFPSDLHTAGATASPAATPPPTAQAIPTPPGPTPTLTPTSTPTVTPTPSPYAGYLMEEIPPCTPVPGSSVDPCGPTPETMLVSHIWWLSWGLRIGFDVDWGFGVETMFRELDGQPMGLEQQLGAVGFSEYYYDFVTHIVARATFLPGTERCTSNEPFRPASYDEILAQATWPLSAVVQCFADVRVNDYILGKGPSRLTVQTGLLITPYPEWEEDIQSAARELNLSPEEVVEGFYRNAWEYAIPYGDDQLDEIEPGAPALTQSEGIRGREVVLFLGPSINHAIEVWQVLQTWNVQDDSGAAAAVHPHREAWLKSENLDFDRLRSLSVKLPRFEQEVTAAHQARLAEYGGRIGADASLPMLISDVHDLDEFMVSAGAYDHPDGPPAQPPPVTGETP